ncbi:peptidoglycan-associated lipoprotein Pal [Thioalkalivibrio sp. ALJT]|uniref:peptidoglycan-associated lipoprotein Pal n=1 Tax=Thioalkalivibrio sp. ALJT TaxID=1158146 RepID=UPI00037D9134|nr:peptidoglycan-associated lipoprotein Pal [Thioalkalivibrio sp. ALJT]
MNTVFRLTLAAIVMAALSACATPTRDADEAERAAEREAAAEQERAEREAAEAEARALGRDRQFDAAALDDPDSPLAERLVYFDFDRDEVKSEFMPMLEAHAAYLSENPGARMRLEGHTDERGTREYNLALGERRAQSVRRVLNLNGVSDDQLEVISYGEEMPVAFQQNEEAWSKNRRVELVYESRR